MTSQARRPPSGATAALALVTAYPNTPPRAALEALLAQHGGRVQPVADALRRPDDDRPVHRDGVVALAAALDVALPEVLPGQRRASTETPEKNRPRQRR